MSEDRTTDGGTGRQTTETAGSGQGVPEWLSLDPDEEVVWVGEPSLASLTGTVVTGVALLVVLVGVFVLLGLPSAYLSIKNTDYVITTKSLYVKKGVLSTNIETVDIDKIQNTEYSQSFWGKQLGYGNIDISTAGSSGADITFEKIENAREVRETISELSASGSRRSKGDDDTADDATTDQLQQLVAELRATREAMERIETRLAEDGPDSQSDPAGTQQPADDGAWESSEDGEADWPGEG